MEKAKQRTNPFFAMHVIPPDLSQLIEIPDIKWFWIHDFFPATSKRPNRLVYDIA
jgi:hypothetical protein